MTAAEAAAAFSDGTWPRVSTANDPSARGVILTRTVASAEVREESGCGYERKRITTAFGRNHPPRCDRSLLQTARRSWRWPSMVDALNLVYSQVRFEFCNRFFGRIHEEVLVSGAAERLRTGRRGCRAPGPGGTGRRAGNQDGRAAPRRLGPRRQRRRSHRGRRGDPQGEDRCRGQARRDIRRPGHRLLGNDRRPRVYRLAHPLRHPSPPTHFRHLSAEDRLLCQAREGAEPGAGGSQRHRPAGRHPEADRSRISACRLRSDRWRCDAI